MLQVHQRKDRRRASLFLEDLQQRLADKLGAEAHRIPSIPTLKSWRAKGLIPTGTPASEVEAAVKQMRSNPAHFFVPDAPGSESEKDDKAARPDIRPARPDLSHLNRIHRTASRGAQQTPENQAAKLDEALGLLRALSQRTGALEKTISEIGAPSGVGTSGTAGAPAETARLVDGVEQLRKTMLVVSDNVRTMMSPAQKSPGSSSAAPADLDLARIAARLGRLEEGQQAILRQLESLLTQSGGQTHY